jgi:hypothetical protein
MKKLFAAVLVSSVALAGTQGLSDEAILSTLVGSRPSLQACGQQKSESTLARPQGTMGQLTLHIEKTGAVSKVVPSKSLRADATYAACLQRTVQQFKFPAAQAETTYEFHLKF